VRLGDPLGEGSEATLRYAIDAARHELKFQPGGPGITEAHCKPILLEPAHYAMAVLEHLRNTANIPEMLEAYAPVDFEAAELQALSFLINKRYDAIRVFEIDDPGGQPRTPVPMPYFSVTSQGRTYGNETMGLGELSLFCLWWNLKNVAEGSLILIDEPEAFTSPHSQYALVDELVRFIVEKGLTVVVATQSQPIIDSVDRTSTRLLVPNAAGVTVVTAPPTTELMNTLGMFVPKHGLLVFEDNVASLVATTVIGVLSADILQISEIAKVNGFGHVQRLMETPRVDRSPFTMVGVLDGDQRAVHRNPAQWPLLFLPGGIPELELQRSLIGNEGSVAGSIGRSRDQLDMALAAAHGLDPHDWVIRVAEGLKISLEQLVVVLTKQWLDRDAASFVQLVTDLKTHLHA
jgi:hypothetical protein